MMTEEYSCMHSKKHSKHDVCNALCIKFYSFIKRSSHTIQWFIITGFVHFFVSRNDDFFQTFSRPLSFIFQTQVTVRFFIAQLKRERNKQ